MFLLYHMRNFLSIGISTFYFFRKKNSTLLTPIVFMMSVFLSGSLPYYIDEKKNANDGERMVFEQSNNYHPSPSPTLSKKRLMKYLTPRAIIFSLFFLFSIVMMVFISVASAGICIGYALLRWPMEI